ncbi:hypothetical protein AVEN_40130-1 [Araneus ventricosus]|uniref:Uncharacterized protein n=1 Tax=Araneus ventricosus TaxID=182803 RepID=A0A4Y2EIZ7_ARAVE|nr:hypothetical protein AVEN_40130-1 [Araneus ventricosus]
MRSRVNIKPKHWNNRSKVYNRFDRVRLIGEPLIPGLLEKPENMTSKILPCVAKWKFSLQKGDCSFGHFISLYSHMTRDPNK